MPLKRFLPQHSRAPHDADDALAIHSQTLHQYYSTVQSEGHPQRLLDEALDRRQARALQARRRPWALGSVAVLLALAVAWLV
jgi:hypothetical protein